MESRMSKLKRIVSTICKIHPRQYIYVYQNGDKTLFKCQCLGNNYDLYSPDDKNISWGLSCETIEEMREALIKDYLEGLLDDIKFR